MKILTLFLSIIISGVLFSKYPVKRLEAFEAVSDKFLKVDKKVLQAALTKKKKNKTEDK